MTQCSNLMDEGNLGNSDGPGLNKRLIYRTTLEQLNVLYNQYGVSVKEDRLIKLLMELCAEQSELSVDVGYLVMTN